MDIYYAPICLKPRCAKWWPHRHTSFILFRPIRKAIVGWIKFTTKTYEFDLTSCYKVLVRQYEIGYSGRIMATYLDEKHILKGSHGKREEAWK